MKIICFFILNRKNLLGKKLGDQINNGFKLLQMSENSLKLNKLELEL
jgi:hypothetical protein